MSQGKLSDLFVQFNVRGAEELRAEQGKIDKGMQGLAERSRAAGQALAQSFATMGQQMQAFGQQVAASTQGLKGPALQPVQTSMQTLAVRMQEHAAGIGQAFRGAGQVVQGLGGAVSGIIMPFQGLALAGIMASGAGQQLGYRFAELSRQIGSLFVPTIEWVIKKLDALNRWFAGLTGEQQKQLRQWALLAAGLAAAATVLPAVIAGFTGLATAMAGAKAIAVAAAGFSAPVIAIGLAIAVIASGTTTWQGALQGVANVARSIQAVFEQIRLVVVWLQQQGKWFGEFSNDLARRLPGGKPDEKTAGQRGATPATGAAALAASGSAYTSRATSVFRRATRVLPLIGLRQAAQGEPGEQGAAEPRKELPPRLGGFEGIDAAYGRIAQASRNIGSMGQKDPQEASAEALGKIYETVSRLEKTINEMRPPVAR